MVQTASKELFTTYFREVQLQFTRYYSSMLTKAGLGLPQFTLLNLLAHCGPLPMGDAGKKLGITKPAVTYLVDRLEEERFLKRTVHPRDRRIFLIELLPKGVKVVKKIQESVLGMLFSTMKPFKEKEQLAIMGFYRELSESMESRMAKEITS